MKKREEIVCSIGDGRVGSGRRDARRSGGGVWCVENVKEEERELYECFESEKEDRREVEAEEEGSGVYKWMMGGLKVVKER